MKYIIEVQRLCETCNPEDIGKYEHFGYINKVFTYQSKLRKYVKEHNPQLRWKGSRRSGYITSTNIETGYRYLTHIYRNEKLNLPEFNTNL